MSGFNINVEGDSKNNKIVTKAEWISVEDRLPENQTNVLVTDGVSVRLAYYKSGFESYWVDLNSLRQLGEITHWMSLPQPPNRS